MPNEKQLQTKWDKGDKASVHRDGTFNLVKKVSKNPALTYVDFCKAKLAALTDYWNERMKKGPNAGLGPKRLTADDFKAMSPEERAKRVAKAKKEIERAQRLQELVSQAEKQTANLPAKGKK